MNGLDTELDAALEAMEGSFHVRLISTFVPDLVWAPADEDAASWLAANSLEFDQFPVKDGDRTVGVLLRDGNHRATSIRDAMHPLREGLIVAADMPITQLIPHVGEHHFRLVLRGGRIDGLVTRSDLLKLPVRMLIFGLVSHLELCLRALVRQRSPWPAWLERLEQRRRQDIRGSIDALSTARLEPDPLEFTNFSDMVDVLADQPDLGSGFRSEATARATRATRRRLVRRNARPRRCRGNQKHCCGRSRGEGWQAAVAHARAQRPSTMPRSRPSE